MSQQRWLWGGQRHSPRESNSPWSSDWNPGEAYKQGLWEIKPTDFRLRKLEISLSLMFSPTKRGSQCVTLESLRNKM